jgi:hypothetical protein
MLSEKKDYHSEYLSCRLCWRRDHVLYAVDEGLGVELGAEDFVGAVGLDGYAPVADEGDPLLVLRGLDLGAEMLCVLDCAVAFYVDQDEIVLAAPEHREAFGEGEGGVNVEAGGAQDLIAQGAKHLPAADVQDCWPRNWDFHRSGLSPGKIYSYMIADVYSSGELALNIALL